MHRDLIVVVPGITGSALHDSNGRVRWGLSLAPVARGIASISGVAGALRLPVGIGDEAAEGPDALTAGEPIDGWQIWPGMWVGGGYGKLLKFLRRTHGDAVQTFGYDWRLSNRLTARLLALSIDRWLGRWRARPGNADAKVILICHSMGGLIARYYLEVLGGRDVARRVITLGTPHSGAVNAVRALTGDSFRKLGPWSAQLTEAAQSFPALHQLLPSYRCLHTDSGAVRLDQANVPDLSSAMVTDGLRFHAEIAAAVSRNGSAPYTLHTFGGKRQPTLQSVSVSNGERQYSRQQMGVNHLGDGTVALFSAVPPEWHDTAHAVFHAFRHGGLPSAPLVLDAIADKLRPVELGSTLASACELGIDLPDVVEASQPLTVTVTADRPDLVLHARIVDPYDGRLLTESRAVPDGTGTYAGRLGVEPGIWRVEVEAVAEHEPTMVSDLITVVPAY